MAEETTTATDAVEEPTATEYTSETPDSAGLGEQTAGGRGQSLTAPGHGVGRRKQAIARVRLIPGSGEWTINGRALEDYFPNKLHQQLVNEPFRLLDLDGRFDVVVLISGGGPSGQAGAVRLGIARSLNQIDEESNRAELKKAGYLRRDARVPERKKAGLKKARKAPQFSKR